MLLSKIKEQLKRLEQAHLGTGLSDWSESDLLAFEKQLNQFSASLLQQQRNSLLSEKKYFSVDPIGYLAESGNEQRKQMGETFLAAGKMGCLILAGGQGSRVGMKGPKGTAEVTPFSKKSLFQVFLEKTVAASKKYGRKLSVAIMTSPQNREETRMFIESNQRFGLDPEQIDLFSQVEMPFLDDQGSWVLEAPGKIATGPNGNGESLKQLASSGILEKWEKAGIEGFFVIPIDNPLADPWDAELCGFHFLEKNQMTVKTTKRLHVDEKMGVLGKNGSRLKIVEYIDGTGELVLEKFPFANINQFVIDLSFAKEAAALSLPWHWARKQSTLLIQTETGFCQDKAWAWKCETFLFDLLDFVEKSSAIAYPRMQCYSPLKNRAGEASFETVKNSILEADRNQLFSCYGIDLADHPVELSAQFYYPTEDLLQKWKGKEIPKNIVYLEE